MFCTACGKQIADGSLFCEFCGAKQEELVQSPAVGQPPVPPAPAAESTVQAAPLGQGVPAGNGPAGNGPVAPVGGTPVAPIGGAAAPVGGAPVAPVGGAPVAPIGGAPVAPIGGTERRPMSPKTKTALIAVAAVLAVVVGAKVILGALFTPEKTIEKFLDAYQNADADAFRAVTVVAEDKMELTDEVLLPFFASYTGGVKNAFVESLRKTLTQDALLLERGMPSEGHKGFRLTEQSYVLFSTYAVEITPLEVRIASEFENTSVEVCGASYNTGNGGTNVNMLPGVYAVTATYTDPNTGVTLKTNLPKCDIYGQITYANGDSDQPDYGAPEGSETEWPDDPYSIVEYPRPTDIGPKGGHADPNPSINIYFDYTYAFVRGNDGLTLKEILVDGKAYAGDLGSLDLYNGFFIGPVNYDSTVEVVTEALGIEFRQEMILSTDNSYCYVNYITPVLPEEIDQKALDAVAAILPNWLRVTGSYDRDAFKSLEGSGSVSPELLALLDDSVSQAWNSAEEAPYTQYDQIDVQKSRAYIYSGIDSICYAQVEMPVAISGTAGYMALSTGEFVENPYNPELVSEITANVSLIYQDGRWVVNDLYWY